MLYEVITVNIQERINSTSMSEEMVTDDDYMAISDLLRSYNFV